MDADSPDIPPGTAFCRGWESFTWPIGLIRGPVRPPRRPTTTAGRDVAFDAGLRAHMLSVYNYMASGVLLTGIVALLFSQSGGVRRQILFGRRHPEMGDHVRAAGVRAGLSFGINRMSTGTAQVLYWAFAVVMGLSLSSIFLVYTGASIALTFFATAAAFASLSLYGYTTKRDLSGMGTFLLMGLVGLIVASIANIFWHERHVQPGDQRRSAC